MTFRRSAFLLLALLVAIVGLSAPASAEPNDSEGASAKLRQALDVATRGYVEAKAKYEASQARQADLAGKLTTLEQQQDQKTVAVRNMAAAAYATGRIGRYSALLSAGSPDQFIDRAITLNTVAISDAATLRDLKTAHARTDAAKAAIDVEVANEKQQLAVMDTRKKQAEQALKDAGSGQDTTGPTTSTKNASPAPRNSDGSWPSESCSVNDPTTSGCITPRTLHAMQEAKKAGFTHYVSCYRPSGAGEHPKGRACDFAAHISGFANVAATGADKTYGTNLAAYFIHNADRLAVMYVIWYQKIWLPSSGWKTYSGCCGPAERHTNHVHLSVY
jgi:peptidoglycan DL-endopeptidase CwlO